MDKSTAFDIISRHKADISLNSELTEALEVALKVLQPERTKCKYGIRLWITNTDSPLHLELSDDKAKLQAHLAEWRKKIVERCKDEKNGLECDFQHGSTYNFTTNKHNKNELPFFFDGERYRFVIAKVLSCNENKFELSLEHDSDAVQDIMSNVLKL